MDSLDFLCQVADLVFANPFGNQRERLDCRLLGIPPGRLSFSDRSARLHGEVKQAFEDIAKNKGQFHIRHFDGNARTPITLAWMFYQYHEALDRIEAHIQEQTAAGDKPIKADFAIRMAGDFQRAGFGREDTCHYIALIFQAARAYCFIQGAILGKSRCMAHLREMLWNNIFTAHPQWYFNHLTGKMEDFSTLILGETGSGKSLVAHTLGQSGFIPYDLETGSFTESFTDAFLSINLSQYPPSLLESELFGHKKGAFTGAISHHDGIFARCSAHGAVFIDEIGDIDVPTQVKLLNILQERRFSPIGSNEKLRFSGRVISATNQDIHALMEAGRFRTDLYYRLCSDIIEMPSLCRRIREDPEELRHLIERLLPKILQNPDKRMATELEKITRATIPEDYRWPGNIRELEQCIRQICIRGSYRCDQTPQNPLQKFPAEYFESKTSLAAVAADYCRFLYEKHGTFESAAKAAGIDRRTIKKYIESKL